MAYTPGPWNVTRGTKWTIHHNPETAYESTMIAEITRRRDSDEAGDNAALIAAAPQLLEALEEILARNGFNQGEWKAARAAITKAREHR